MEIKKRETDEKTVYLLDDELIRQAFIDAADQEWNEYEQMELKQDIPKMVNNKTCMPKLGKVIKKLLRRCFKMP